MHEIRISFQSNADDFVEAQLKQLKGLRVRLGWSSIASLGFFYAVVITLLVLDHNLLTPFGLAICAAAAVSVAFIPAGYRWELQRGLRKLESKLRQEFPGGRCIDHAMVFGDDGWQDTCKCGTDVRGWQSLQQVDETDNLFLFRMPNRTFYNIPKRAFTPEQLVEFRELLQRKLPEKK